MAQYKGVERRKYRRLNRPLAVNIIAVNNKKTLPKLDAEIGLNIAEGGMLLECSKRLPKKTRLKLKIILILDSKYKIIQTTAVVLWNKKTFKNTYYLVCKFTRLRHKDRITLKL